jgi:hypothetical protein
MQRRKYLAAVGSLAAAGAAGLGTGAFTSVQADRAMAIEVSGDAQAYLALTKGPNVDVANDVVDTSGDQVKLNFDGSNTQAGGLNEDGITQFANVLTVENQGTTEAIFGVDTSSIINNPSIEDFNVYAHNDTGSPEYDGEYFDTNGSYPAGVSTPNGNQDPLVDLAVGEAVDLSFQINTNGNNLDADLTLPFIAVEKGGRNDNTNGDNF